MVKLDRRCLLIATHNKGKIAEYADILGNGLIDLLTLAEVDVNNEVPETGSSFIENATLKAVGYARQTGLLTLADDSGLEVDALAGQPGVYSARYGGPGLSFPQRYNLLLENMSQVPDERRMAHFRCVVVLAAPDGTVLANAEGTCEGYIARSPAGDRGFGYDPVFYVPDYGLTMAQLPKGEKNRISHRGRAARAIAPFLLNVLGQVG